MAWVGSNSPRVSLFLINLAIVLFFAYMIDGIFESYRLRPEPKVRRSDQKPHQNIPWWPRLSRTLPPLALFPIAVFGCGAVVGLAGMAASCSRYGAMRLYHGMLCSVLLVLFSTLFFLHYAVHNFDLDDRQSSLFVDSMAVFYERTYTMSYDLMYYIWDYIQHSYRCCGMVGDPRQSFMDTAYYKIHGSVPKTCCRYHRSVVITPVNETECGKKKKYLHTKACMKPVLNFISALILVWGTYAVGVIAVCMYLVRCCYGNCAGGLIHRKCACYLRANSTYRRRLRPSRFFNAVRLLDCLRTPDCLRVPCSMKRMKRKMTIRAARSAGCTIELTKKEKSTRINFDASRFRTSRRGRSPNAAIEQVDDESYQGPVYLDVCSPNTPGKETRPR